MCTVKIKESIDNPSKDIEDIKNQIEILVPKMQWSK